MQTCYTEGQGKGGREIGKGSWEIGKGLVYLGTFFALAMVVNALIKGYFKSQHHNNIEMVNVNTKIKSIKMVNVIVNNTRIVTAEWKMRMSTIIQNHSPNSIHR